MRILDADQFSIWLASAVELNSTPDIDARLDEDLGIDHLKYALQLVHEFDKLVEGQAPIREDIYHEIRTVRDLYLYYLFVCQCPLSE